VLGAASCAPSGLWNGEEVRLSLSTCDRVSHLTASAPCLTLRGGGIRPPRNRGVHLSTTETAHASASTVSGVDDAAPVGRTRTDSVRDWIHTGACVLAGVLITVGFLLDPAVDTDTGAETIAAVAESADRFYWANTMSAFGLAMTAAVGLAVLRLVRGRGRVLATIGGVLMMIGGTAAAAGIFMYGAALTGMVESGVDHSVLAELQDHLGDSWRPGLAFLLGFAPLLLGMLLSAIALFLSRAVPRWVPIALGLGAVAIIALGDTDLSTLGDVLLTIGLAGVGLGLWRATVGARTA
jgi:hypothetical protein